MNDVVIACPVMNNNTNVSMIVRSASCFGASKVIVTGNNRVDKHISRDCSVSVEYRNSLMPIIDFYKKKGYCIIGIEQCQKSENLFDFCFPQLPILFTMGKETSGMKDEVLNKVDMAIEIPVLGSPNCFNVATATSLCLYEISKQRQQQNIRR